MKVKKKILISILTVILSVGNSVPIMAGTWQRDSVGWWWQEDNGNYPVNTWQWIDGNRDGIAECYYFDNDGYCMTNSITPDGYLVNPSGAWMMNGTVQRQTISNTTTSDESGDIEIDDGELANWKKYIGTFCSEDRYALIIENQSYYKSLEQAANSLLNLRGYQYMVIKQVEGNRVSGELNMHGGFDDYSSSFYGVEISNTGTFQIIVDYMEQGNSIEIVEGLREPYSDRFTAECTLTEINGHLAVIVHGVSKYPPRMLDHLPLIKIMDQIKE